MGAQAVPGHRPIIFEKVHNKIPEMMIFARFFFHRCPGKTHRCPGKTGACPPLVTPLQMGCQRCEIGCTGGTVSFQMGYTHEVQNFFENISNLLEEEVDKKNYYHRKIIFSSLSARFVVRSLFSDEKGHINKTTFNFFLNEKIRIHNSFSIFSNQSK